MTSIAYGAQAQAANTAINRITAVVRVIVTRLIDWHRARKTRNALHNLSDRELDDIGFSRGDIDHLAHRHI